MSTHSLIEISFNTFTNRADQDQASTLFAYGNMIRFDPTLVDLISNLFVPCTKFIYIIIHSGWSLA